MAISRDKYIGKFVDEALENIGTVESLIFEIRDGVSAEDDLVILLRALHTLKGSSRMLEFKRIEGLSHSLETVFIALKEQRIHLSDAGVKLVTAALDTLREGTGKIRDTRDDAVDTAFVEKELAAMAANEEFTLPGARPAASALPLASPLAKPPAEPSAKPTEPETAAAGRSAERAGLPAENGAPAVREKAKAETIRFSLEKIDGIVKSAASLQSLEIAARAIAGDHIVLRGMIKDLSHAFKAGQNSDPGLSGYPAGGPQGSLAADFKKLEKFCGKINAAVRNHAAETANYTRDVYNSVISLRMLPISSILDVYPRYVFELAQEMGKKVRLSIEGRENEIDKNIIDVLKEVFLHVIRNAVDHGIESPEERRAAGKPETGRLEIRCSRKSGSMEIVIADDGRGIDLEKIRRKIVEQGYMAEDAAASLSREELTNYIFQSGFSTSAALNNISGRGVGMDVVRSNIERLKGSITVEGGEGRGTAFVITVPLSIAALMGFPVTCGGMRFIIPAVFVDTILLVKQDEIITVVDRPQIRHENRIIKLYYLDQILGIKNHPARQTGGAILVIIIRAYEDELALAVATAASMRTVILKPMPAFLRAKSVFSGVVLGEDYEMVPTLHIPTVIKMARRIKGISMKKRDLESKNFRKSVLVVDDSLPTREIESDILKSDGYRVDTAAGGVEALNMAKLNRYDLICTDLNMPQMDGFMLTENIKKNDELKAIPVIVISSRSDEEDQKRAAMLGASRYIVKNSFNNHNLLTAVHELIGASDE
ncbi:MAG: response regulator [Treponema sp.]|jgi:chemotaxis protein histidine kinase CheA/CheY-like chemotaxis protein|nr:response regulator [Treponema sp.]